MYLYLVGPLARHSLAVTLDSKTLRSAVVCLVMHLVSAAAL